MFCFYLSFLSFFFFFQAEDGIRDVAVTGVQTCALPISTFCSSSLSSPLIRVEAHSSHVWWCRSGAGCFFRYSWSLAMPSFRSEERRVGKECRSRGGLLQEKKE